MPFRSRTSGGVVALLLAALLLGVAPAGARPALAQVAPDRAAFHTSTDRLIVHTRGGGLFSAARAQPDQSDAIAARLSARADLDLAYLRAGSAPDTHLLQLPSALPLEEVEALAAQLAADPEVSFVEPDRRVFIDLQPNDPFYASQLWNLQPVRTTAEAGAPLNYGANLSAAWDITTGSPSIVTAIVDTGGLLTHQDLAGRTPDGNPGYDMISEAETANDGDGRDNNPADPGDWCQSLRSSWHGSHVAGIIGAASNNGLGVTGVSWGSKLLHVRALGTCGGYSSDIADAVRWAAGVPVAGAPANPNPARVINMSLGGDGACSSQSDMQLAINAAVARGAVIVVAAGNENVNLNVAGGANDVSPAECAGVITVAATARNGQRASYSNYGSTVEIAAPGGDRRVDSMVVSTVNTGATVPVSDGYAAYDGTSMAAPHVAGTVALMLSVNPGLTNAEVLSILQSTVTPFPAGSCTTSICGAGILNAGRAVEAAARRFSWQITSQSVSEGAGLVKIRAQLSSPASREIRVPYTVSGTATADDFTLTTGTLVFPPNSSVATLTFPVLEDSLVEGAESISVSLGTPEGAPAPAILAGPATHVIAILDNEAGGPTPTLRLGAATASSNVAQVTLNITVERQSAPGAVSVGYVLRRAGSASRPIAAEGEIALGASENSKTVAVTVSRSLFGTAGSVELSLEAPTGGAVLGTPTSRQLDLVALNFTHLPIIKR